MVNRKWGETHQKNLWHQFQCGTPKQAHMAMHTVWTELNKVRHAHFNTEPCSWVDARSVDWGLRVTDLEISASSGPPPKLTKRKLTISQISQPTTKLICWFAKWKNILSTNLNNTYFCCIDIFYTSREKINWKEIVVSPTFHGVILCFFYGQYVSVQNARWDPCPSPLWKEVRPWSKRKYHLDAGSWRGNIYLFILRPWRPGISIAIC